MGMIDYKAWSLALAKTESDGNPRAWGDDHTTSKMPLAVGRWQMHLAFVDEWWPDGFEVNELTTWDELFDACLREFFDKLSSVAASATQLAMWFHLHGNKGGGWDAEYAKRFEGFYGEVHPV